MRPEPFQCISAWAMRKMDRIKHKKRTFEVSPYPTYDTHLLRIIMHRNTEVGKPASKSRVCGKKGPRVKAESPQAFPDAETHCRQRPKDEPMPRLHEKEQRQAGQVSNVADLGLQETMCS